MAPVSWSMTVLGLSPLLMLASSGLRGFTLALISASTLALCPRLLTLLSARWPALKRHGFALGLLIAATWVTIIDLLLQWLCPDLREALGAYAPLTAGSYLLLMALRGEGADARSAPVPPPTATLGAALTLPLLTGAVRELLGTGRLLGDLALISTDSPAGWVLSTPAPLPLMALPPGALLVIAALLAWRSPPRPSESIEDES